MNFEYRVKGKVEQAFILRGHCSNVGTTIDLLLSENELEFVKERCSDFIVSKLNNNTNVSINSKLVNSPEPVLEETKTENKPKEIINELQTKRANNVNKGKHKENL